MLIPGHSGHFWAKIQLFEEGAKVLVLAYQKTNYAPHSHCFLVGHSTKMDQKSKYLANLTVFGPKVLISKVGSKTFGILI